MATKVNPAVKQYWFGKAYRDLAATIKDAHARNLSTAETYWNKVGKGNWFANIFFTTAAAAVVVAGTIVWMLLIPIHVLVVASFALAIMGAFVVMYLVEQCFLLYKGWSTFCRHCGERIALPEYQCSKCRVWHSQLRPSSYGIFQHRCSCGELLPCTFLSARHALKARCPHEHCEQPIDAEIDTRSSTSVIVLIGPPNSGKTGFMISAMDALIKEVCPKYFLDSRFTDVRSEEFYEDERRSIIETGSTRKTVENKPPAFNVFLTSKDQRIRHQVYFFDAAGEIFLATERMQSHYQFKHITGGVIVIDPFSLPGVKQKYAAKLRSEGLEGLITQENTIDIIDRFLIGMQKHFGLKQEKVVKCPYAVVVTKADLCNLHEELHQKTASTGLISIERRKAESSFIRSQLQGWGAAGLISQIEMRFSNTMYFVASPIRLRKTSKGRQGQLANVGVADALVWMLEAAKDPITK